MNENNKKDLNICLGIDLGTTNCAVSYYYLNDQYRLIENNNSDIVTPSFVYINKDNTAEVGVAAKRIAKKEPQNVFSSFKRLMGQKYVDVMKKKLNLPYQIVEGANGMAEVMDGNGRQFSPIFLSSLLLKQLREDAERTLRGNVTKAVITVPAYFNNDQREATKEAGKMAGLEVVRIINEPTAAALQASEIKRGNVMVFDLGGGTFDVSLIEKDEDVYTVRATGGDTQLGGRDFDNRLFKEFNSKLKSETGRTAEDSPKVMVELQEAIESAKKNLTNKLESDISLTNLDGDIYGKDEDNNFRSVELNISRAAFENMNMDLVDKTLNLVKDTMKDADWSTSDVHEVILAGGMTRMPLVQEKLVTLFGESKINSKHNPDTVVSLGAARQGAVICGFSDSQILLMDVTPFDLGIETLGGRFVPLVERNTKVPVSKEETFSTAADNQTGVTIAVFQGNRPEAHNNHPLGSFELTGIEPQPRNVPQIKVKFDIDVNGMLTVSAKDMKSGKAQEIIVTANLSDQEKQKIQEDIDKFAAEDEERKKFLDKRSALESLVYGIERQMEDRFQEEQIHKDLREVLDKARELYQSNDRNRIAEIDPLMNDISAKAEEYNKIKHAQAKEDNQGQEAEKTSGEENKNS